MRAPRSTRQKPRCTGFYLYGQKAHFFRERISLKTLSDVVEKGCGARTLEKGNSLEGKKTGVVPEPRATRGRPSTSDREEEVSYAMTTTEGEWERGYGLHEEKEGR